MKAINALEDRPAAPPVRRCEVVVVKTDFTAWGEKQLSVKKGQRLALIEQLPNEAFMRCMTLKGKANELRRCGRVPVGYAHRVAYADRDFASEGEPSSSCSASGKSLLRRSRRKAGHLAASWGWSTREGISLPHMSSPSTSSCAWKMPNLLRESDAGVT